MARLNLSFPPKIIDKSIIQNGLLGNNSVLIIKWLWLFRTFFVYTFVMKDTALCVFC